jgi:hypothetical protein
MIPVQAPPTINPLVDAIFDSLPEPEGFEFESHDGKYLWPVFGQDSWRLVMVDSETKQKVPVFFNGNVIRFLANALTVAMEEIKKTVTEKP